MKTFASETTAYRNINAAVQSIGRTKRVMRSVPYADRPVEWVREELGEFVWSKSEEVLRSVAQNRRTAVPAAHDVSKSWTAARAAAWWIAGRGNVPEDVFVVTTAPTFHQVRAILWQELSRAFLRGRLPGRLNQTEWWIGRELVALGRKPADWNPEAFQGIHAAHVLVIIDEASGVPKVIWDAADTLLTNVGAHILAIGNPDDPGSEFARVCESDSRWNVIAIDGFDSPNFTGEEVPAELRNNLLSELWVEEKAQEWGEDSAIYQSKVRGRFAADSPDSVVPLSWLRAAQQERNIAVGMDVPVELGVDFGAGGDQTVIRERRGVYVGRVWRTQSRDPMDVAGRVVDAIRETGAVRVKADVIGIGWGVVGRLRELGEDGVHPAQIIGVNVAEVSARPDKFPRLRDQLWWEIGRELTRTHGWYPHGLDDRAINELIAPKYSFDSAGRIKIEPKAETRKRIGRSTDDADALLLAYYGGSGARDLPIFYDDAYSDGDRPDDSGGGAFAGVRRRKL